MLSLKLYLIDFLLTLQRTDTMKECFGIVDGLILSDKYIVMAPRFVFEIPFC